MAIPDGELCDRYEQLYPGAVADILDNLGYTQRTLPSSINPLTKDMRFAGIAYPVRGRPDEEADYDENIRRFLQMLGAAPMHSVVAYETNDAETAHLGELSTAALQVQGCRGAVVDGGVRDARHILEQEFPVFTRYQTPADAPPRWRLEEWDVPIRIGEVEIRSGDVLVGDLDGVVCVPAQIADDVLERAEEKVDTEDEIRDAIRDGVQPIDAYEEYGTF
jgi:regulator of RNase E activity RraA